MNRLSLIIANRNYSSWSMRAWLALRTTGAPFDEVVVPLGEADTRDQILRWSPSGRVPALRDGELVVWDSLAICEHLAERFPEAGLWPTERSARAVARSVVAEMHSGFMALRSHMPMNLRASRPGAGRGPGVDDDIARIIAIWEACRRDFGAGGELLFGRFGIADAFFAPVVSRFLTYGVAPTGAAGAYMAALWAEPAVREWAEAARAESWRVARYET
ncbi:MAG: glutathione S-transferase family protein [Thermoanaerobaculales bacterium]|jgi:glutathione S-transferase|nr:glutathione S-transferase family protein [Thermoanaerobaculales bacterium]